MPNLPTWPDKLPQFPFTPDDPPEYKPQSNVTRTAMSVGPAKARRRCTARVENLTVGPIDLNQQQVDLLEDFIVNDLAEVKPFLWFNFRRAAADKVEAVYRFPDGWASVSSHKFKGTDNTGMQWYEVTLELEMLPWQ